MLRGTNASKRLEWAERLERFAIPTLGFTTKPWQLHPCRRPRAKLNFADSTIHQGGSCVNVVISAISPPATGLLDSLRIKARTLMF